MIFSLRRGGMCCVYEDSVGVERESEAGVVRVAWEGLPHSLSPSAAVPAILYDFRPSRGEWEDPVVAPTRSVHVLRHMFP